MAISQSFSVEFNDSVLDTQGWKSSRYLGKQLSSQKINEFNDGDTSFGRNPVITSKPTALYIGSTLISAENEDPQYAIINKHSYLKIDKILIIDNDSDEVQIIDSNSESSGSFQRFVTSNLPTNSGFSLKLLDKSIQNSLNSQYFVKFNKGWLLRTFDSGPYHMGQNGDPTEPKLSLTTLFNGTFQGINGGNTITLEELIFIYGSGESNGGNNLLQPMYPTYLSSSVIKNKFTEQYYNYDDNQERYDIKPGTFSTFDNGNGDVNEQLTASVHFSASRFIGGTGGTLDFLRENSTTTELHLTLLKGEKDFAKGQFKDERSIGTFEVDANSDILTITSGTLTPSIPFLTLKGGKIELVDEPTNVYFYTTVSQSSAKAIAFKRKIPDSPFHPVIANNTAPPIDITEASLVGLPTTFFFYANFASAPNFTFGSANYRSYLAGEGDTNFGRDTQGLFNYSGSFHYQLSFLDKEPVLISDIDKEKELYDGIGEDGFVLIPSITNQKVKDNLEFYLEKAGLINKTTSTLSPDKGR